MTLKGQKNTGMDTDGKKRGRKVRGGWRNEVDDPEYVYMTKSDLDEDDQVRDLEYDSTEGNGDGKL